MTNNAPSDARSAVAVAVALMLQQGYEATSVDELADAAGISRSTFFRRYRSKEDMIFADHERLLVVVREFLSQSVGDPMYAVAEAALMVFDHHVQQGPTSLARYRLLQQVPALRDRELVTSHSYTRAFGAHLQDSLPEDDRRSYFAVAAAAALVAVHNSYLRQFLRSPDALPEAELRRQLETALRDIADTFRRPKESTPQPTPGVLVTAFPPGTDKKEILAAIEKTLLLAP
ncbi:TetR family transcriptional regulator [Pseudarthrobacter equi]|nr:TetR family transcriptional regulator [Pseudarthrobacter equi]